VKDEEIAMRRHISFGALFLAAAAGAGCGDNLGAAPEPSASISMDLTQTPPSARCAGIFWAATGAPSAGGPPNRMIPLTPEKTAAYLVTGLPTGSFAIREDVYTQACGSGITGTTVSMWTSDPITVNLKAGATVDLTFNLRLTSGAPQLNVHTNFPDPPNAIAEFLIGDSAAQPVDITSGPDGNLWFTVAGTFWDIGSMTPTGNLNAIFSLPAAGSGAHGIAAGADGALWFTESSANKIGRITTAGVIAEWSVPSPNAGLLEITAGSDGNMWFTESAFGSPKIGRITPAGAITEFNLSTGQPTGITAGPDGNIWYAMPGPSRIGRITVAAPNINTDFAVNSPGSSPVSVAAGSDGNIWFAEDDLDKVGKMTTAGVSTEFNIPTSPASNRGIVGGPDGNLWFCEQESRKIGRVTTGGSVTEFAVPVTGSGPTSIAAGSDGNLWFVMASPNVIARIRP
jgi:virginiamycin B lyase